MIPAPSETTNNAGMLTTPEAARLLGLSAQTLADWRCRGIGPRFCKLGRAVRYSHRDLLAFAEASRVEPSDLAEVV